VTLSLFGIQVASFTALLACVSVLQSWQLGVASSATFQQEFFYRSFAHLA
jgi:hypothetical protein